MSDVSVLGCGRMGRALIEALADADTQVTIWNRTPEKAEALTGPRVSMADTVGGALAASPTTFVCISNYADTQALLDGLDEQLADKTVVQLCSGRPDEAQTLSERVTAAGGAYVDGSILSHPPEIGTDSARIFYAGDAEAFKQIEPLVAAFGGTANFVGEDPRDAAIREMALLVPGHLVGVGISLGAKLCEREDISLDWYTTKMQEAFSRAADQLPQGLQDPEIPMDPKQRPTVRSAEGAADMATYLLELDIDPRMHEVLYDMYATGFEDVPRKPET